MRYIDTGSRDPDQALGAWLTSKLTSDVTEFRFQTGFFSGEILGLLGPTLGQLASSNRPVRAVVGSNDGCTLGSDVIALATAMGVPRSGSCPRSGEV